MRTKSGIEDKNERKPLISVIVPVFNAEPYLRRCLQSIRCQDYQKIEVILIDDGSTDQSSDICRSFVEVDRRFYLFTQKNRGVSNARNLGLEKVKGTYLLFVDSDDYIKESYITKLWTTLKMSDADMVVCDYRQECLWTDEMDMFHYTAPMGTYRKREYINILSKCPGAHYFGVLWNKIYRTEFIRSRNLKFDTGLALGEDFTFNMEYISLIKKVRVIDDKLYVYSWKNPSSLTHYKKNTAKQIEERLRLYHAYENLFRREKLYRCWRYKLK